MLMFKNEKFENVSQQHFQMDVVNSWLINHVMKIQDRIESKVNFTCWSLYG